MFRSFLVGATAMAAIALAAPASAQDCQGAGTVGSGGSAAAGDTSASTLGTGAACDTGSGTNATVGSGGSAATAAGKAQSMTHTHANKNNLQSQSKAQAMDKGTFSKSMTKTKIKHGDDLQSRTKTMSHVPGQKPVMDRTTADTAGQMTAGRRPKAWPNLSRGSPRRRPRHRPAWPDSSFAGETRPFPPQPFAAPRSVSATGVRQATIRLVIFGIRPRRWRVYSCRGVVKSVSVSAISTISPPRMTATRSHIWRTTGRS